MKLSLTLFFFLLSHISFASELTFKAIRHLEGFQKKCHPDNYQISGGYGSGFLCKDSKGRYLAGRKITVPMAEDQLKKDYTMFRSELLNHLKFINKKTNLKLTYSKNEIEAIVILMYQKGWSNMVKNGFIKDLVNYKLGLLSNSDVIKSFTKMSCYKNSKTKVHKYNKGLYKRHYATAKMFQGKISNIQTFIKYQEDSLKDKSALYKTVKYCESRN